LRVRDVLPGGEEALPRVGPESALMDVLCEISAKGLGAACVTDAEGQLLGIITDYDVRHAFQRFGAASFAQTAATIMNPSPAVTLRPDQLAYDALRQMEERSRPVSVAPIVEADGRCLGMVRVHDLVRAGL
jgi:arabinose-5-phosphate isomerase